MHSPETENPGAVAASGLHKSDLSSGGRINRRNATAVIASQPKSDTRCVGEAIKTALKIAIVNSHSFGNLSQERAIRLIRAFGLEAA